MVGDIKARSKVIRLKRKSGRSRAEKDSGFKIQAFLGWLVSSKASKSDYVLFRLLRRFSSFFITSSVLSLFFFVCTIDTTNLSSAAEIKESSPRDNNTIFGPSRDKKRGELAEWWALSIPPAR